MGYRAEISYEDPPKAVMRRAVRAAREGVADAARVWHRKLLPIHFTFAAVRRYAYAARTKKYEIRKAKLKRHRRPLVWSGETRRQATTAARFAARKSREDQVGEARMPVPRYFFYHPHNRASGRYIDKVAELTAVTREEEQALGEVLRRRVLRSVHGSVERMRVALK